MLIVAQFNYIPVFSIAIYLNFNVSQHDYANLRRYNGGGLLGMTTVCVFVCLSVCVCVCVSALLCRLSR